MTAKLKPGGMAAALKATMADESAAKAPVVDAIAERMRRADALSPPTIPPPAVPPAAASTRKRRAPKRVRHTKRDSFNLPLEDHALIQATIERAVKAGTWTTKSSVVRAGLRVLARLGDEALREALGEAHPLTPGRKPAAP